MRIIDDKSIKIIDVPAWWLRYAYGVRSLPELLNQNHMNKPKRKRISAKVCVDSVVASIEAGRAKRREIYREVIAPVMTKYLEQGMHAEQAAKFARKEVVLFGGLGEQGGLAV